MKNRKRLACFLLSILMVCSLLPINVSAAEAGFSDMPAENHWSYEALNAAVKNELLIGSGGRLMPDAKLTRAQLAAIVNRAFGAIDTADISAFSDVPENAWYRTDIAKAVRMQTFFGDGTGMRPDDPISREEAFSVLARAFRLENAAASALDRFTDRDVISAWAVPALAAMADAGYVKGSNGYLNPKSTITRAEFAQVMFNMVKGYYSKAGTYSDTVDGNLMINVPDVTLKAMTVKGDLIIGEGVGNGDVTLDNVKVEGRLLVRGGGENSIHIINKSDVGSILIGKTGDGGVRVRTEEGCRVEAVNVEDGQDGIILEGEFNQVVVNTDAPVVLNDADVTGLTLKAENTDVKLNGETSVSAVKIDEAAAGAVLEIGTKAAVTALDSAAENVSVSGSGKLGTATVSGDNTVIDTKGTSLTVEDGTGGVSVNGKDVDAGETVTTGKTPAAPSGGVGGVGGEPPAHTHRWDAGTVTTDPTCTQTGVRTYTCSCGQTRTETIEALDHDWDDGVVTTPATATVDGVMTFTCKREGCGATRTETISKTPFTIQANQEMGISADMHFTTFEAALAEAVKHLGKKPCVVIEGYVALTDVTLPAGCQFRTEGATLVLNNCTFAGEAEALEGAQLFVQSDSKLFINDKQITGEGGAIVYNSVPGEHIELAVLQGETGETLPALGLIGVMSDDTHPFTVEKNIDLTDYFCGMRIGDHAELTVEDGACLKVGFFNNGEESCLRVANGSVDCGNGIVLGTTEGCTIRMKNPAVGNPGDIALGSGQDGMGVTLIGADVEMSGELDCRTAQMNIRPYFGEGAPACTLTIKAGSDITLGDLNLRDDLIIEEGAVLTLNGNVQSHGSKVINNGTLIINGRFTVDGDDASLTNSGTIRINNDWGEFFVRGAAFTNNNTIINNNVLVVSGTVFTNSADAELQNNRYMRIEDAGFPAPKFINNGTFTNGTITAIGEQNNGSNAECHFFSVYFRNGGNVTNNGHMWFEGVEYEQTADTKLETYNAGGLEIRSGSMSVPYDAEFRNEGYMKIIDSYGEEYEPCDLSGFEDFFTTWNQDGNDSHWCEFTAEVYDLAGYDAAVEEQNSRPENMRYNRLDFRGDITFEEDVTFDDFDSYWLNNKKPATDNDPWGGMTMTVKEGVTLTIGNNSTLVVNGDSDMRNNYFNPCKLIIDGALVIAPEIQEEWNDQGERIREHQNGGNVEIWADGFFDAGNGSVTNNGTFEVRYFESGFRIEENGEFRYEYNGNSFYRPETSSVIGAPNNAIYAAEVRTEKGFRTAVNNTEPVFDRLRIRDDCTVTLHEDITVPASVHDIIIDGGSGMIVDGSTLTLNCRALNNHGDISIYGNMIIGEECWVWNKQNLEVGALSGGEIAVITVNGSFGNNNHVNVYNTGSIVLADGSQLNNNNYESDGYVPVLFADGAVPAFVRGGLISEALTLNSTADGVYYEFDGCRFEKDITVVYTDGHNGIEVEFRDSSSFAEGVRVLTKTNGVADYVEMDRNRIQLLGARNAVVASECPIGVGSGWGGESFTVNGVTTTRVGGDYWISYCVERDEHTVFQVDSNPGNPVKLTGSLNAEELRLQQGNIDISELVIPEGAWVLIHDEFQQTEVAIGSNAVEIDDGWNPDGYFGYTIQAGEGAKILVRNAQLEYIGGESPYQGTPLTVVCGGTEYWLDPHIFGLGNTPSVYVGVADEEIEFTLTYGDAELTFDAEIIKAEGKTHLFMPEGAQPKDWFTAEQDDNPNLILTVELPEGVTVVFNTVPLKPEWGENEQQ